MSTILSGEAARVISELLPEKMPPRPPAPIARPFWQTEPCPPWCDTTHRDEDYHEDRDHFVHGDPVGLNLYRTDLVNGEHGPGELLVGLTQHYREAEPEVDLTVPATTPKYGPYVATGEQGVRMTVAEARALRDRLSLLLAMTDDERPALEVELTNCDQWTRRSAEHVVTVTGEDSSSITSCLLQWTERDAPPDLEVDIMVADISRGCTPAEARDAAAALREAAEHIERLAAYAEKANAATGAQS